MRILTSEKSIALLSLPSLLTVAIIGYVIHCFVQHAHLRHFKGPRTVGFSKLWLLKVMRSGRMHLSFTEANRKYGAPEQSFSSPSIFFRKPRRCLGSMALVYR